MDNDFAMLIELAEGDLTKVDPLKKISNKILIEQYYLIQVKKLNEMIEHVAYLHSLENNNQ